MSDVRVLDPSEFDRLKTIEEGFVPDSEQAVVIVAEEEGEIIGRTMLLTIAHVEGTWVHPEHRKGTVLARLIQKLEREAKTKGLTKILAYSFPDTDDYLHRLGFTEEPFTVWSKEI